MHFGDIFMTHTTPNYFIHYCPWWFMRTEQYAEVLKFYNHYESHNMAAYYTGGTIPAALDSCIQAFAHGYRTGRSKRPKSD